MNGLSIIIPIYNEERGVLGIIKHNQDIMQNENISSEIIVVNDGSTDIPREILEKIDDIYVFNHDLIVFEKPN